ncbi:unannotated protein [freshwater metagenome]|nr:hypothetical protein [Actinomycetota bacterium]
MLKVTKKVPSRFIMGINNFGRRVLSKDVLPLWNPQLPGGGTSRVGIINTDADILYFPSCVNSLFGPPEGVKGVNDAFLLLCSRANIKVRVPEDIASLCCGTPWKSKGLSAGYESMSSQTRKALIKGASAQGIPVVSDSTSCTDGLADLVKKEGGIEIVDALAFISEKVLPVLKVQKKISSLALHPTCSGVQLGLNAAMHEIASAISDEVVIPENWACCGYAGDRGMLHPELTQSATRAEAREITARTFEKYASSNRPCEIGLSDATGQIYVHLLQLLEEASRP